MGFWLWIIGIFAVLVAVLLQVERRRGSRGASRGDDLAGGAPRPPMVNPAEGISGQGGYGSGGAGAG